MHMSLQHCAPIDEVEALNFQPTPPNSHSSQFVCSDCEDSTPDFDMDDFDDDSLGHSQFLSEEVC